MLEVTKKIELVTKFDKKNYNKLVDIKADSNFYTCCLTPHKIWNIDHLGNKHRIIQYIFVLFLKRINEDGAENF